jgi:hypothetical protein
MATVICSDVILFGADLSAGLKSWSSRWDVSPNVAEMVAARAFVLVTGYAYSLILSGAMINILSRGFRQDWGISRRWNFPLLAGPFVFAAVTNGYLYPGLWAGVATHVVTLFVGWRWTDQPPAGLFGTLKNVQNLREQLKINSMNVIADNEHVIGVRRGRVISVSYGGALPADDKQLSSVRTQIRSGKVALGYSDSKLILSAKNSLIDFDLADVTDIWLARPATIKIRIGVSPDVSVQWKDRAKSGIEEFAGRLASAREARLAATRL